MKKLVPVNVEIIDHRVLLTALILSMLLFDPEEE